MATGHLIFVTITPHKLVKEISTHTQMTLFKGIVYFHLGQFLIHVWQTLAGALLALGLS